MNYDYFFHNATIIDGSGRDSFVGDVAVQNDTIVEVSRSPRIPSGTIIDAKDMVLCPGFIDIHGHSDLEVLRNPSMEPKIGQGITTEVAGNCGVGVFPANEDSSMLYEQVKDVLGSYPDFGWEHFDRYVEDWKKRGSGTNMAFLQAHSALRCRALSGNPNRPATSDEVDAMVELLKESYEMGCIGFSSGLYYAPCLFADRRELLALLAITKYYDRFFAVHIRCEGDDVIESLEEVIDLAKLTGVKLEISHLKAIGRENQILVPQMLSLIEKARMEGVDVLFDQYPYEYGSTSLFSLLPPQYLRLSRDDLQQVLSSGKERQAIMKMMVDPEGWDSIYALCGWDNVTIVTMDSNQSYEGMTLTEIASIRNQGPFDAFFDLLQEEKGSAVMTDITQSQESLKRIMSHPLMCFGTDALYAGAKGHPRSYQAAIHLLDRYWKQQNVMPLEMMIGKMTSESASRLGFFDRGRIEVGCKADLVLFDPKTLKDNSSESDPTAVCDGLLMVMVNGKVALKDGKTTGICSGTILGRKGLYS